MNSKDYYKTLGINKDASQKDIKNAYKKLASEYHPDKYRNNPLQSLAEEKMKEINEAYEVLGNTERRASYDSGNVIENCDDIEIITLLEKGKMFLDRRQYDSARAEFEHVLDIDPDIIDAHYLIGISYMGQEHFDMAISSFEKILRIDPDIANVHYMTGICYVIQEKFDIARKNFEKVIKLIPEVPDGYNQIGICYLNQNNFDSAIHYFKKASQLEPDNPVYLENIGYAYGEAKNSVEALHYFNQALKLAPDRAEIYMNICYISAEMGWYEEAEKNFNTAKKLDPGHPMVQEWEKMLLNNQIQQQQYMTATKPNNNELDQLASCAIGCCVVALLESIFPGSSQCLRCGGS